MLKKSVLVGAPFGLLMLMASSAQAWETQCNKERCGVSISVDDAEKKQHLLTLSILRDRSGANPGMVLTTPLGVGLEPGARILVSGQEIKLPFKVCYPNGCQAFATLTPESLSTLRLAQELEVQFFIQTMDKPTAAKIDLAGLAEALDKPIE